MRGNPPHFNILVERPAKEAGVELRVWRFRDFARSLRQQSDLVSAAIGDELFLVHRAIAYFA